VRLIFALALVLASCKGPEIKVKAHTLCRAAAILPAGADCANDQTSKITPLSYREYIDFLEAQPERTCVPVPGMNVCADDQAHGVPVKLPARAPADAESDDDFTDIKTVLEQACAELKDRCSPETITRLKNLSAGRAKFRK
jgi:hypothetical protein